MRNVRQFLSGMKNYLVGISPESADLKKEIKKQTELLSDCEFLNIDAILEEILGDLVISPLHQHICSLIEIHVSKNEQLKLHLNAQHNAYTSCTVKSSISSSNNSSSGHSFSSHQDLDRQEAIDKLRRIYVTMEESVSPIKKLDKWNEFVCQVKSVIYTVLF